MFSTRRNDPLSARLLEPALNRVTIETVVLERLVVLRSDCATKPASSVTRSAVMMQRMGIPYSLHAIFSESKSDATWFG